MKMKVFILAFICASSFNVPSLHADESAQCITIAQGSSSDVRICPSLQPETAQQFFEIGIVHVTQGAIGPAIEAWDRAIELNPFFVEAYVAKADWLMQQKEFGPALSALEDAYRKLPRNPEIAYMLGKLHAQARRYQAAWNYFMVTLQQKPNHVLANYELGLMLESMDKPERALSYYEKAAESYHLEGPPKHLMWVEPPLIAMARIYYQTDRPEKALFTISRWFAAAPPRMRDGQMYEVRGRIFDRLGRYAEAAEDYDKAIQEMPTMVQSDLLLRRAIARQRAGKIELATSDFDTLLSSDSLKPILQLQVYLRSHGYRAVRINGKSDAELRRALAECLRDPKCGSDLAQSI